MKGIKYCQLSSIEIFFFHQQISCIKKGKVSRVLCFFGFFFWSIGFLYRKRTIQCYSHPHRNGLLLEVNLIVSDSKRNHLDLIMQLVTFYWDTDIFPVVWEEKKIIWLWSFAGSVLCQGMQGYMQTFQGEELSFPHPPSAVARHRPWRCNLLENAGHSCLELLLLLHQGKKKNRVKLH